MRKAALRRPSSGPSLVRGRASGCAAYWPFTQEVEVSVGDFLKRSFVLLTGGGKAGVADHTQL
jgi:hypothetical protein